jgi:hypothetical protein
MLSYECPGLGIGLLHASDYNERQLCYLEVRLCSKICRMCTLGVLDDADDGLVTGMSEVIDFAIIP